MYISRFSPPQNKASFQNQHRIVTKGTELSSPDYKKKPNFQTDSKIPQTVGEQNVPSAKSEDSTDLIQYLPESRVSPRELRKIKKIKHPLASDTPVNRNNPNKPSIDTAQHGQTVVQNLLNSFQTASIRINDENNLQHLPPSEQKNSTPVIAPGKSDSPTRNQIRPKSAKATIQSRPEAKNISNKSGLSSLLPGKSANKDAEALNPTLQQGNKKTSNSSMIEMATFNNYSTSTTVPLTSSPKIIASEQTNFSQNIPVAKKQDRISKQMEVEVIKRFSREFVEAAIAKQLSEVALKGKIRKSISETNATAGQVPHSSASVTAKAAKGFVQLKNPLGQMMPGSRNNNAAATPSVATPSAMSAAAQSNAMAVESSYMSPVPSFLAELRNKTLKTQLKKTVTKPPANTVTAQKTSFDGEDQRVAFEQFLRRMEVEGLECFDLSYLTIRDSMPMLSPFQAPKYPVTVFSFFASPTAATSNKAPQFQAPAAKKLFYDSVSLLGRGKFASVYSVQSKFVQNHELQVLRESTIATNVLTPFAQNNDDAHLSHQNEQENADNKILALKIAQFRENDLISGPSSSLKTSHSTTSYPPKGILDEFEREILSLHRLGVQENIIQLLGYSARPFGVVMEYASGQNLYVLMHNQQWQVRYLSKSPSSLTQFDIFLPISAAIL